MHFNRGVSECNLSPSQRVRVCDIFEHLVYAHDEQDFNDAVLELKSFPAAANYFYCCWDVCKEQWAFCYTKKLLFRYVK